MLKKILIVFVVLAALTGFLLSRDWDSPALGRAVLSQVTASTGIQIAAEGFKLNLLKGLVLDEVTGTVTGDGGTLTFAVSQLVFEHRIMPLLSGTVAIDRVLVGSPTLEFREAVYPVGAASAPAPPEPADDSPATGKEAPLGTGVTTSAESGTAAGLALDVKLVRIEQGALVARNTDGNETMRVDGLDFEMTDLRLDPNRAALAALSARGVLSITAIEADTAVVRDARGSFELADAHLTVPELQFSLPSGRVTANTDVDFNHAPFTFALDATSQHDLNLMLETPGGLGPASARFAAEGVGSDVALLQASGDVELAPGQFPASPVLVQIDDALGKPVLANASYEATTLSFRLRDNRLTLEPFRLTTPSARLDVTGELDLAGPLDFSIALATPREGLNVEGTSAAVLDVLADNEGWVPVPFRISGTLEEPRARPDVGTLASMAASGAKREATEKATDALRGLIKRKIR